MARDHARMKCSMWNEHEWRALPIAAQHAYQMLAQHEKLSYCGVLTYAPSVLAELALDATEPKIKRAVKQLEAARYVITDRRTHELLVRSYVRHDGVMDRLNMGKATATALARVVSPNLRDAVIAELARHMVDHPDLSGWVGFQSVLPNEYDAARAMASAMPYGKE